MMGHFLSGNTLGFNLMAANYYGKFGLRVKRTVPENMLNLEINF
jgi:hypothetical protein